MVSRKNVFSFTICALIALVLMLSACGGDDGDAPVLQALPTRTPLPATATPEPENATDPAPDVNASARLTVVSMDEEVSAFLTAAQTASALDRIDLISEYLLNPQQACFTSPWIPDTQPLELFEINPVSLPLDAWQAGVDIYPTAALVQRATAALDTAAELLPRDTPFRACLMPFILFGMPDEQGNGGINTRVLGSELAVIGCRAGEYCLETIEKEAVWAYAFAYQIAQSDLTIVETPLVLHALYYARAADFTRQLYPDAQFYWDNALTPEQEVALWERLRDVLNVAYQTYPEGRYVDRYLYGLPDHDLYKPWGGVFIGQQIVTAYRAGHPNISSVELLVLDPDTLLTGSDYDPAAALDAAQAGAQVAAPVGVEIVSLRDDIAAFVAAARDVDPTGREAVFEQTVSDAVALCASDADLSALLNIPDLADMDLDALQAAVESFPEEELIAAVGEALSRSANALPLGMPVRACLLPVPQPDADAPAYERRIQAAAMGGDLLYIACGTGPDCLDGAEFETARGFAFVYQHRSSGQGPDALALLDALVYSGRADDFAAGLYPDAVLPWAGALDDAVDADAESTMWTALQPFLADSTPIPAWRALVYGAWDAGGTAIPEWAGAFFGDRIVSAYRAQYPDVAWGNLALIAPDRVLEVSGYGAD
ncbi:MAG: hypothetical protein JXQ72_13320 [Anaerolineae bacterium]|nr:hypothetical protein [Anaerolineae bacterium]